MTPTSFLNHVDQRVNPRLLSWDKAEREIDARGLRRRYEKMERAERLFLRKLEGKA